MYFRSMKLIITRFLVIINVVIFLTAYTGISLYKHSCSSGNQFIELSATGGFHQHGCCESSESSCCESHRPEAGSLSYKSNCCNEETHLLKIDLPFNYDERKSDVNLFPVLIQLKYQDFSIVVNEPFQEIFRTPIIPNEHSPGYLHKICRINT